MGMKQKNCINWSQDNSKEAFAAAGNYARRYRKSKCTEFTKEERDECIKKK